MRQKVFEMGGNKSNVGVVDRQNYIASLLSHDRTQICHQFFIG
ncbi:MAG TPA: hypothetical protein VMF88_01560 [Bacteroidota bacterium]|nr:hypothetical protein [Bacteroidota bacterium]